MKYVKGADSVGAQDATLLQSCGTKLQDTFEKTSFDKRIEDNHHQDECSPWISNVDDWKTAKTSTTAVISRKLVEPQKSRLALKGGNYGFRAGYFIQKDKNNQVVAASERLEIAIADAAMAGLALGATVLATVLSI